MANGHHQKWPNFSSGITDRHKIWQDDAYWPSESYLHLKFWTSEIQDFGQPQSWRLVPFQHKYGFIKDERSGVESYPYQVNDGQRYINFNPGRLFLFSSHPKRERVREGHLNYYASAYNRGVQSAHRNTKLNQIRQKQACISELKIHATQYQHTQKLKPGLVASYDIRPRNGVGLFW